MIFCLFVFYPSPLKSIPLSIGLYKDAIFSYFIAIKYIFSLVIYIYLNEMFYTAISKQL